MKLCLRYAAESVSLFLLAILNLRLAVCPTFLWLISVIKACLRSCDVPGETHTKKLEPLSAFMHLVTQSLENTSHLVKCISSFLKSLFFLCSAFLHLFQGSFCLLTALIHPRNSVIALVFATVARKH